MSVRIVSIGTSFPMRYYTQDQLWDSLGYEKSHLKRIFTDAKISKRHLYVDPATAKNLTWQDMTELYDKGVHELAKSAVDDCIHDNNNILRSLGCVIYVSCTGGFGSPSPALKLGLNVSESCKFIHIGASGCGGGFPGLDCALRYVEVSRKPALIIDVELCSCTFYPESLSSENDYEVLRANALFGDAAVAALVSTGGVSWPVHHPVIIDSESNYAPQYLNELGFTWRNGRLRVLLSKRVKDLAPLVVKPALMRLLNRNNLKLTDIRWVIAHAAGSVVIDNFRDHLGIDESKLLLSREILNRYGNCSSTTIGLTGKLLMTEHKSEIMRDDYCLVIGVAPGMVGGVTLLKFR